MYMIVNASLVFQDSIHEDSGSEPPSSQYEKSYSHAKYHSKDVRALRELFNNPKEKSSTSDKEGDDLSMDVEHTTDGTSKDSPKILKEDMTKKKEGTSSESKADI